MDPLVKYIKQCKKQGLSDTYIRNALRQAGHPEHSVDKAFIQSRKKDVGVNPALIAIFSILLVASSISLIALNHTGYSIKDEGQIKELILNENIQKINAMNITQDEKQERIQALTLKVDELFSDLTSERQMSREEAIRIINKMLE